MSTIEIVWPCIALVVLTAIVWVRLYVERIGEIRARRIDPQALATVAQGFQVLRNVKATDNFRNLFEVPVLFYVLCVLALTLQLVSPFLIYGSWIFVALRATHSVVHITYNRVIHRFALYTASTVVLFAMWTALAVELALRH